MCDCRLSWIRTLRNDTPNDQIREALDLALCMLKIDGEEEPAASQQENHQTPSNLQDAHVHNKLHRNQQHRQEPQQHYQDQQQQGGLEVQHRVRFFGTAASTDGPGFVRDEAVDSTNNKHIDDSTSIDDVENESGHHSDLSEYEDDNLRFGMKEVQTEPTPMLGPLKKVVDLDPEMLPCPQPVKQQPPTVDNVDVEPIGHEFDEANGVQTLTGTTAAASAMSWSASFLLYLALIAAHLLLT